MKKFIINNTIFICLIFSSSLIISGCNKDVSIMPEQELTNKQSVLTRTAGVIQISSIGVYAATGECTAETASYVVSMTGDLTGCLYTYVDAYDCSPGGTYLEEGREHFVGMYKGQAGSFWTTYKFESKFEACSADGAPLGGEIKGRCQHPIVVGSGDGVFTGVTGRMDMKDDIEAGTFIIRGHLSL